MQPKFYEQIDHLGSTFINTCKALYESLPFDLQSNEMTFEQFNELCQKQFLRKTNEQIQDNSNKIPNRLKLALLKAYPNNPSNKVSLNQNTEYVVLGSTYPKMKQSLERLKALGVKPQDIVMLVSDRPAFENEIDPTLKILEERGLDNTKLSKVKKVMEDFLLHPNKNDTTRSKMHIIIISIIGEDIKVPSLSKKDFIQRSNKFKNLDPLLVEIIVGSETISQNDFQKKYAPNINKSVSQDNIFAQYQEYIKKSNEIHEEYKNYRLRTFIYGNNLPTEKSVAQEAFREVFNCNANEEQLVAATTDTVNQSRANTDDTLKEYQKVRNNKQIAVCISEPHGLRQLEELNHILGTQNITPISNNPNYISDMIQLLAALEKRSKQLQDINDLYFTKVALESPEKPNNTQTQYLKHVETEYEKATNGLQSEISKIESQFAQLADSMTRWIHLVKESEMYKPLSQIESVKRPYVDNNEGGGDPGSHAKALKRGDGANFKRQYLIP